MDLDSTRRESQTGKFLFDPSADWLRAGQHREPDLAVDGLRSSSLLSRFFGKLLRKR